MRIRILGTGALATLFGARLARAGVPVVLAGSWKEGLEALSNKPVRVDEEGGSFSVRLQAVPRSGPLDIADLAIVLVKSYQTRVVAPDAGRALSPEGRVLTLQNGLGNAELLEAYAPGRLLRGVATLGATLLAPGHVSAQEGSVLVEPAGGTPAEALRNAGIEASVTDDISKVIWRKLAVNCAINPLSAILGVPNGALLEDQDSRDRLDKAAREVGRVAQARGNPLSEDPAQLAEEVARRTASNRSSMLQDLDRGHETEIDALNGAVVREGDRLGVATPVNRALVAALMEKAERRRLELA